MTDREWDKTLRIQTMGREDEQGGKYMPYEPTPYSVLARLAESGFVGSSDHVLDYGCGKGRAAFFLVARTGCRATGIDRSEKLVAMAEANRSRFERAGRICFERAQAERYAPRSENVFFFFNPFSEDVLRIVLRRILGAWEANPRRLRLIFYYPSDGFQTLLASEERLVQAGEIDCRDLFDGDNPRERLLIFETAGD